MKIIIGVETIADWGETETVEFSQFEWPIGEFAPENVGLSLADGKELLHRLQQVVIEAPSEEIRAFRRFCSRCRRRSLKDYRKRKVDMVFGTVAFRSARIVSCPAAERLAACSLRNRQRASERLAHYRWRKWSAGHREPASLSRGVSSRLVSNFHAREMSRTDCRAHARCD